MGRESGGWKYKRSAEEYAWALEMGNKILLAGKKLGKVTYAEYDLYDAYKKKFGKTIKAFQLSYMMHKMIPQKGKTKEQKSIKKILLTIEQSKFILYVFNEGIFGFPTKDEVKKYLIKEKVVAPVSLFENIPLKVQHNVEVIL